jgi:hypothetical protein
MYARLVRFSLGPDNTDVARTVAVELTPKITDMPGCRGVTVFGNDEDGECGLFVLWDSEAEANAAAGIIRPQLDGLIGPHIQDAPDARLFRVLSA